MKIVALVPCLDEEATVGEVVRELKKYVHEVVVIDNGSRDGTAEKAEKAGAKVVVEERRGKGWALRRGFEEPADLYVVIDGDGTYPAGELPELLSLAKESDMVIGVRRGKNSPVRSLGNRLLTFLFNLLYSSDIRDLLSGYRVIKRELVERIDLKSTDFRIETEMTAKAVLMNAKIAQVEVSYGERKGGKSKLNPLIDGIKILFEVIRWRTGISSKVSSLHPGTGTGSTL